MENNTQLNLKDFVTRLIEEKGLSNLDDAVREQVIADLLRRVENRVNAIILKKLPEDKMEEFDKLLESGSDEEVQEYVKKYVPNADEEIAAELLAFRQTYLG